MSLTTFNFNSNAVRAISDDQGEVLFVGKDVCEVLGYKDTVNAIKQHCRGMAIHHPHPRLSWTHSNCSCSHRRRRPPLGS